MKPNNLAKNNIEVYKDSEKIKKQFTTEYNKNRVQLHFKISEGIVNEGLRRIFINSITYNFEYYILFI